MTPHSIRQYYNRLLFSIGIRNEPKRRHEFSVNGFRKYFKTMAEQAGSPVNVEILMGHSVGISDSYYRPTEQSLREDYLKAVDKLTVLTTESAVINQKLAENQQALVAQMQKKDQDVHQLRKELNEITNIAYKLLGEFKRYRRQTDDWTDEIPRLSEHEYKKLDHVFAPRD